MIQRSVVPDKTPGNETIIRFKFTDIKEYPDWWMVVKDDDVDLCVNDPGKDVDIYFTSTVKAMTDIWMGDSTYKKAIREGELILIGDKVLTNNITSWLTNSMFADLPAASDI